MNSNRLLFGVLLISFRSFLVLVYQEYINSKIILNLIMTSGQLQIRSFDLFWLLVTVSIVRTVPTLSTDVNPSLPSLNLLVIQRPRFAGGLLKIPLDVTVQLTQCSMKDIARNIIRFRYGTSGKRLVVRAVNASERKQWITALSNCMSTSRAAKSTSSPVYRTSKTVGMSAKLFKITSNYPAIPQGRHHARKTLDRISSAGAAVPSLPLYSLDAIKRLAEGYDNLARQWAQVATETQKFHAEINSLQLPCVVSERTAAGCTAY